MTPRIQQASLWLAAVALGGGCGWMFHTLTERDRAVDVDAKQEAGTSTSRAAAAMLSPAGRYLWRETAALRDAEHFDDEVEKLHRESRSPLRAESMLSYRIHDSSFDEWESLIAAGKVKRIEFLGELGEHLARTDTRRALQLMFHGRYGFENLDQLYAFRDPLLRTATEIDGELVLETLQAMKRGGSQMDASLYFSAHWAKTDPRAAAGHFAELVRLRNMNMDGSPDMPDATYANMILKSWWQKAPEEAEAYITTLDKGPTREALEAALRQLVPEG
ncbi:hypothetical protein [Luteolibacter marinus]|uniref:hypothetical protein n=1 Tax=Luteolibacter marinus TaxID=2776705 RepID=UPI001868BD28|nr:hypothetical protein [Luteolibacter marinus]